MYSARNPARACLMLTTVNHFRNQDGKAFEVDGRLWPCKYDSTYSQRGSSVARWHAQGHGFNNQQNTHDRICQGCPRSVVRGDLRIELVLSVHLNTDRKQIPSQIISILSSLKEKKIPVIHFTLCSKRKY